MSIDFSNLPHHKGPRRNPLIHTGDREGWEEIRDGGKWVGEKVADGAKAVGRKIAGLFGKRGGKHANG